MLKRVFSMAAVIMLFTAAAAAVATSIPTTWGLSDPERMQQLIAERVEKVGAPGAAWVAVQDGSISYSGATGVASLRSGQPLTPRTPMAIGSVSKPFTAVAVMQLVEAGSVDLDTPVVVYLPYFQLSDEQATPQITVRQLLSHSSGISTVAGNLSQTDLDNSQDALEARVRALSTVRPTSGPGVKWQYSNANYQILGALIEQVSGMDYAAYIDNKVFRPLGMEDSYVHSPPSDAKPATGHKFWFGHLRPTSGDYQGRGSAPQGGLYVSSRDLGLFLAAMVNGRSDVLGAEAKAAMMREQPGADNYGLGWHVRDVEGKRLVWHPGEHPSGFAAIATLNPERRAAFAIITNAHSGFALGDVRPITLGASSLAFGMDTLEPGLRPLRLAIVAALAAFPFIAIAYIIYLLRWSKSGPRRRHGALLSVLQVGLPLILLWGTAWMLLFLIPQSFGRRGAPLSAAWLYSPDTAILLVIAAASLIVVGLVRTWALLTSGKAPSKN